MTGLRLTRRFAYHLTCLFVALSLTSLSHAQTTYRWVDKASGQTIFSDQPPPPGTKQTVIKSGSEQTDRESLPYATRQAAAKYPVTLFTTANCVDMCKQARDVLNARGIPFSEKMLQTQEELDAASRKLGSEVAIPSLLVGDQNFKGFEAGAWNNLLDLAGYPASAPYGAKASGAFTK
jgi:glutaredoxin